MNAPEPSLTPETLDELLSADIDGELAQAAADLGFTLEEATAALAAAPGAAERLAALMRARDLLATHVPLPESVELRLVASALDHPTDELRAARERPRRARQLLVAVGSAAAAAAVIAGVVALGATKAGRSTSSKASSVGPLQQPLGDYASRSNAAKSHVSVAFGDVSNPRTLGAEVETRLAIAGTPLTPANLPSPIAGTGSADATGEYFANGGAQGATGPAGLSGRLGSIGPIGAGLAAAAPTGPTGPAGGTGPAGSQDIAYGIVGPQGVLGAQGVQGDEGVIGVARPKGLAVSSPRHTAVPATKSGRVVPAASESRCTAAIRRRTHIASAPVLSGTGTDAGVAAVVAVFRHGQAYVVYVMAASDCTLLSQQTLP